MADKDTQQTLREHIIWLGSELEKERRFTKATVVIFKRMLDPEDLGHAVPLEVRQLVYQLLIEHHHNERDSWHNNN